MTDGKQPVLRDTRFAVWIGATAGLFVFALAVGFIWLPSAQRGADGLDLWAAICRAVGLPNGNARISAPIAGQPASQVAWTTETRRRLAQGNASVGAALAQVCNDCHGTAGISADAIIPNLAGQSAAAIYKQLDDYKSGKRDPALMGVYVFPLSDQNLLDLAAHYALLPSPSGDAVSTQSSTSTVARRLIDVGAPLRGIAPCASCHGPVGVTPGAPGLDGQQRAYLELQMQSFKDGTRRNDISEQMRSVARQLTSEEIAMLAAHYSSISDTGGR
ncbi:c-type cytochrome [Bradyrhizobium sp. RDI18]|uniref:c-type cytochrome n=1 Tax=Bradyrhizobium sp. RDI18 TaxID=3367400 RepID=UPI00371F8A4D